jgi:cytochrome c-type biogenesis protein CcmH
MERSSFWPVLQRAALFLFVAVAPALAVQPDEILTDPALEARARSISTELRCLVCQNQSIDDSDAPLAKDLRVLIRERLTVGDSDREAVDYVVARYGDFVLLKPRFTAQTWALWFSPFAILLIALIFLLLRRKPESASQEQALSAPEKAELERIT